MKIDNGYFQFLELEQEKIDLKKLTKKEILNRILEESPALEILIDYVRSPAKMIPQSEKVLYSNLYSTIRNAYILAKSFNVDTEEAIEECVIALFEWIREGASLSGSSIYWREYRIVTEMNGLIHLPVHILEQIRKTRKAIQDLEFELGRLPTLKEIGWIMCISPEKVEEILRMSRRPVLFSELLDECDDDISVGDIVDELTLITNAINPAEEQVDANILKDAVLKLVKTLTPREQMVITLRYGLVDGKCKTLEEIGKRFNLTHLRIREIEAKAIRKLRNPTRSKHLRRFLN